MSGHVAVIGTGNLGGALVRGLLATGTLAPGAFHCVVRRPERATELADELAVRASTDVAGAVSGASLVVLGVKPQMLPDVLLAVAGALAPGVPVVSLAAGVRIARLEEALPAHTPVVRVMTNTPIAVEAAVSAVARGRHATDDDVARVVALLAALGRVLVVDEEAIDAVTATSGSGPAYVFLLAEAMIAGAEALGLSHAQAVELTVGTIEGAAALLDVAGPDVDPAALRRAVTSPGGTTAAALAEFEAADLVGTVARAMAAAARRAAELGA